MDASGSEPFCFQLKGPVRQISCASQFSDCKNQSVGRAAGREGDVSTAFCLLSAGCVAVRSDRLCGVWRFGEQDVPRLLQVVNTREVTTCVSVR